MIHNYPVQFALFVNYDAGKRMLQWGVIIKNMIIGGKTDETKSGSSLQVKIERRR